MNPQAQNRSPIFKLRHYPSFCFLDWESYWEYLAKAAMSGQNSAFMARAELNSNLPALILASASPRRFELLLELNLQFKVVASEVPEIHNHQLTAVEVSQINAYRKARAVAKKFPDALVLGADTLVYLNATLFGKPNSLEDAYEMLEQLQGQTHHVVTAICLLHLRERRQKVFADTTAVTFRPLDAVKIRRYLNRVNPLDKAGAYAIQEEGDLIVEKIAGSYTNVVGLPLERLRLELQAWADFGSKTC